MRILFLGLNYAPEQIGIAVYSAGLCEDLAARGHEVRAVAGKPYYPQWRIYDEFRGSGARHSVENGVSLTRVPHYVPAKPTGAKRMVHHASFARSALRPMLREARVMEPDIVMTVAPSLIAAPVARMAARRAGVKSWLHIQDFEVDAAFATGLVGKSGPLARLARGFERSVITGFDKVSSISHEMCARIGSLGVPAERICEFRNWAEVDAIHPLERPSEYRELWNITTPHVALYSGNIANKQGIEILVDVARRLHGRDDLTFVICGEGPNRANLERLAQGLTNIQFHDLQPLDRLNELMGLATIHLLPQKGDVADLVLPSKLTNMLASGRPVVTTAHQGTGLAREVEGCGRLVEPEDPAALAQAIEALVDSPGELERSARASRERALSRWHKASILDRLEAELAKLASSSGKQGS